MIRAVLQRSDSLLNRSIKKDCIAVVTIDIMLLTINKMRKLSTPTLLTNPLIEEISATF